jgi:hypothetical protein
MLNDYKPTHDPNLDTFKVHYLIGAAAVLALVFPYKYSLPEVGLSDGAMQRTVLIKADALGFFHLA